MLPLRPPPRVPPMWADRSLPLMQRLRPPPPMLRPPPPRRLPAGPAQVALAVAAARTRPPARLGPPWLGGPRRPPRPAPVPRRVPVGLAHGQRAGLGPRLGRPALPVMRRRGAARGPSPAARTQKCSWEIQPGKGPYFGLGAARSRSPGRRVAAVACKSSILRQS